MPYFLFLIIRIIDSIRKMPPFIPNSYPQNRLDVYGVWLRPIRFGVIPRLSRESLPVEEWTHAV